MITKLTKSAIDRALPRESDYFIWDTELRGFGVRIWSGGRKTYVCKYRAGLGRTSPTRRFTIGAHGSPWTVDQARSEARRILGQVANGQDPAKEKQDARNQLTVCELCDLYLERGTGTKKPSTLATDRGRIERHIKPLLGRRSIADVTKADIKRFLQDVAEGKTANDIKTGLRGRAIVRGGKGTATRTVGLLGGIFAFAVDAGLIASNPVRGVKRYPDHRSQRYLSHPELVRLGEALLEAQRAGKNAKAIAIIQLLIFTGARRDEIAGLTWDEVDLEGRQLYLGDSKTGQRTIPLNAGACEVIADLKRHQGTSLVFPAEKGGGHYQGTPRIWKQIRDSAGLNDVRIHDLRHSFASFAASGGTSLLIIGKLLGHRDFATTMRYAHLQDDPLKTATEDAGNRISASLSGRGT